MRKNRKRSFSELVNENKIAIQKDEEIMARIEKKLEERHMEKAQ